MDDMVICCPAGKKTAMVALDKNTGERVWQTESLGGKRSYVSPVLYEYNDIRQILGMTSKDIYAVNPDNGEIVWSYPYYKQGEKHNEEGAIITITPIYKEDEIFVTAGYDFPGIMLKLSEDDFQYIESFDVVHSSIYSYLEDQIADLRKACKFLSFDYSYEPDEGDTVLRTLPFMDLAVFSIADLPDIEVLSLAQEIFRSGPKIVLLTQGSQGSWAYDGFDLYHQEVIEADVVDTMGAGDAYIAAFVIEFVQGMDVKECMKKAAQFAASACQYDGAFGYGQRY